MNDFFVVYGLTIISLIITVMAQVFVNTSYAKYKKVRIRGGITGSEAARQVLDKHGLKKVKVVPVKGTLSDHYDPRSKTVRLSNEIYSGSSIAAVSVACHEVGHALQDKDGYSFMRFRSSLVPITNLSSKLGYLAIAIGLFFGYFELVWIGILFEVVILLFQLVTLPVEFNASSRALKEIKEEQFLTSGELKHGRKMLSAAAFTYVASVTATLIQILRLVLMVGRRRD